MLWVHQATGFLARTYLLHNEWRRVETLLDTTYGHDATAQTLGLRLCWCARAELALACNDPGLALSIMDRLIASTANLSEGRTIPRLWKLRGEALAGLHRVEEAETALQAACEGARAHGASALLWRIHAALGTLYHTQGRHDDAKRESATARTIVEQLAANVPDEALWDTFMQGATAMIPLEAGYGAEP